MQHTCAWRSTSLRVVFRRSEQRHKYLHGTHGSPRQWNSATVTGTAGLCHLVYPLVLEETGCKSTDRYTCGQGQQEELTLHDASFPHMCTLKSVHDLFRGTKTHSLACTALRKMPLYTKCFSRSTTCTTTSACCKRWTRSRHPQRHAKHFNVNTPLP